MIRSNHSTQRLDTRNRSFLGGTTAWLARKRNLSADTLGTVSRNHFLLGPRSSSFVRPSRPDIRCTLTKVQVGLVPGIRRAKHQRPLCAVFRSADACCMLGCSSVLNVEAGRSSQGDRYVVFKSTYDHSGSEDVKQRAAVGSETSAAAKTRLGHSNTIGVGWCRSRFSTVQSSHR